MTNSERRHSDLCFRNSLRGQNCVGCDCWCHLTEPNSEEGQGWDEWYLDHEGLDHGEVYVKRRSRTHGMDIVAWCYFTADGDQIVADHTAALEGRKAEQRIRDLEAALRRMFTKACNPSDPFKEDVWCGAHQQEYSYCVDTRRLRDRYAALSSSPSTVADTSGVEQ